MLKFDLLKCPKFTQFTQFYRFLTFIILHHGWRKFQTLIFWNAPNSLNFWHFLYFTMMEKALKLEKNVRTPTKCFRTLHLLTHKTNQYTKRSKIVTVISSHEVRKNWFYQTKYNNNLFPLLPLEKERSWLYDIGDLLFLERSCEFLKHSLWYWKVTKGHSRHFFWGWIFHKKHLSCVL